MNNSELLIYQAADSKIKIDVRLEDETVWLTQDHMAGLFGKAKSTINEHIKNIFAEGDLVEADVMKKFRISAKRPFLGISAIFSMRANWMSEWLSGISGQPLVVVLCSTKPSAES